MFKRLWTSPVWSKVIATGIVTIVGFLIAIGYSLTTNLDPKEAILFIWHYETKIGYFFITLILLLVLYSFLSLRSNKKGTKASISHKKEKKFCDEWYKINGPDNNIVYRFNTYISSYTKQPFVADLTPFCTNHNGQEWKMRWLGGCPDQECSNHFKNGSEREMKDQIESLIIVEWEKFNGKY